MRWVKPLFDDGLDMQLSEGAKQLIIQIAALHTDQRYGTFLFMKRDSDSGQYVIVFDRAGPSQTERGGSTIPAVGDQFDMQELKDAGLVNGEPAGKTNRYKITGKGIQVALDIQQPEVSGSTGIVLPVASVLLPRIPAERERLLNDILGPAEIYKQKPKMQPPPMPIDRVFIGHGRSQEWLQLLPLLMKLGLKGEEFNINPVAGMLTTAVLNRMFDGASAAIIVATAEDEHVDGQKYPRLNVAHEIGMCQVKFGSEKTILLVEEGCQLFSNIAGLTYIPFKLGCIRDKFWDIQEALRRENIIR